jgi:hypothetical protein
MSVGFVVGAADGLLVVVDDLKSDAVVVEGQGRAVVSIEQRKFAISARRPVAVVPVGQAGLAGSDVWEWVQERPR